MKYLIIGGVAGGATAAARMRRISEDAEIILFEKGEHISYANCGLPYYIGGVIADREKLLVQTPGSFSARFNVDVRVKSEVTSIDPKNKTVTVKGPDGTAYTESYDRLLLSPGASPVRPPLPGIDSDGIFTLRNVADTDAIKARVQAGGVKRAVIVGGGFIGLEMAENLSHAGAEVAVVEMAPQVMAPIDFSMAQTVHGHLAQKGVRLYLETAVESFSKNGDEIEVRFSDGRSIAADMVILSIGVRPNTALAADAGLEIGPMRGIKVDACLRTSDPDIYAVGDAIEYPHPITGKPWLNYLAGPANRQARIVADNMVLDAGEKYEGSIGTSIAKVFDLTVAATGLPAKRLKSEGIEYRSATIHPSSHASYYPDALPMTIKVVFAPADGRLLGAQIVGYDGVDKRIDVIARIIKSGGTVADLTRIEQAYAPPFSSAKDPAAIAGYVAQNILSGRMAPIYWRELRDAEPGAYTLIDVRTPMEYATGALPGAINIPLDEMRSRLGEIPAGKPIVLYCGVGLRGYLASNILRLNGFADVRNLIGGIKTYRTATAPIPAPKPFDMNRPSTNRDSAAPASAALKIDACGLSCPGPIMKLKEAVDGMAPGQALEITATDPGFARDAATPGAPLHPAQNENGSGAGSRPAGQNGNTGLLLPHAGTGRLVPSTDRHAACRTGRTEPSCPPDADFTHSGTPQADLQPPRPVPGHGRLCAGTLRKVPAASGTVRLHCRQAGKNHSLYPVPLHHSPSARSPVRSLRPFRAYPARGNAYSGTPEHRHRLPEGIRPSLLHPVPESRRNRPDADPGIPRHPCGPLVEPRGRKPGHGPGLPHRAAPERTRAPPDLPGHH